MFYFKNLLKIEIKNEDDSPYIMVEMKSEQTKLLLCLRDISETVFGERCGFFFYFIFKECLWGEKKQLS